MYLPSFYLTIEGAQGRHPWTTKVNQHYTNILSSNMLYLIMQRRITNMQLEGKEIYSPQQKTRQKPGQPQRMPKEQALALVRRFKKSLIVASVFGFGIFSGLVAYHQVGTTTTVATTSSGSSQTASTAATSTTKSSTTSTSTSTATQNSNSNSNSFLQQGGNNVSASNSSQGSSSSSSAVTGSSVSHH